VAASRPPPASISSEPAAKGTSAPVAGGAITALPLSGLAVEVAEVPSTPEPGAGEVVGTAVGVGMGPELATGIGVAVPAAVEVLPLWVDFDVVWLDDVVLCVVCVVVVDFDVGVGVAVAADTTCTPGDPESIAPAGP
jgi:hypothetical protein